jgi:hypothetical protein
VQRLDIEAYARRTSCAACADDQRYQEAAYFELDGKRYRVQVAIEVEDAGVG